MANNRSITDRMIGAAKLDVDLYEEVEADTSANGQAFAVVIIVSLAAGIGSGIYGLISGNSGLDFLWGLLIGLGSSIIGWLLWALVTYIVGVTLFKTRETEADYGQLLRTLGFAHAPGIFRFFIFIPFIGGLISFVASVWVLITGVIAVRQALDFSTWRAIGTCIVGLIPFWVLYGLLTWIIL